MNFFERVKTLKSDLKSRAEERRQRVASDLAILIAKAGMKRKDVAHRLDITEAALSIRLNGSTNLTLDSIGGICDAAGFEFDVHFRRPEEAPALSFWEIEEALMPPMDAPEPANKTKKTEVSDVSWLDSSRNTNVVHLYAVKKFQPAPAANQSPSVNNESQRAAA